MEGVEVHRPRNLDWPRASALLYGDWGTSKAYVIGLAFAAAGFSSFPIIVAVCGITALVGLNYVVVCRCFPDGGGVYSAARYQGRTLAVLGALLLVADLTVTAALSGWEALRYLGLPHSAITAATIGSIMLVGALNFFGPRHSGSFAVALALPMVGVVISIIALSLPHLTLANLEPPHETFREAWVAFVSVILALSGVEAIANLTGTMKADKKSPPDHPQVGWNSLKAILPVGIEVSVGTALLGWAMLSLPKSLSVEMHERREDMMRFLAEQYGSLAFGWAFGEVFGWITGIVVAMLLLSAVNTAIAAMIGLLFMVARDGEMPRSFTRLNAHGVPLIPLAIAVGLPIAVLLTSSKFEALAGLYAIGVVGAICVNLGACTFNRTLPMHWFERLLMGSTFLLLAAVELTLAWTKHEALFFVMCVLIVGMSLRAWAQHVSGIRTLTVPRAVADLVNPEIVASMLKPAEEAARILVCVRGITPVLKFAFDEAHLRKAILYVLYVREVAVLYPGAVSRGKIRWKEDPEAEAILSTALKIGEQRGVPVVPVFANAESPAQIIVDTAATLGADFVVLGASHRGAMTKLLKGSVVNEVAATLPDNINLVISG